MVYLCGDSARQSYSTSLSWVFGTERVIFLSVFHGQCSIWTGWTNWSVVDLECVLSCSIELILSVSTPPWLIVLIENSTRSGQVQIKINFDNALWIEPTARQTNKQQIVMSNALIYTIHVHTCAWYVYMIHVCVCITCIQWTGPLYCGPVCSSELSHILHFLSMTQRHEHLILLYLSRGWWVRHASLETLVGTLTQEWEKRDPMDSYTATAMKATIPPVKHTRHALHWKQNVQ